MKKHITTALFTLMMLFFGYGYAQKANNQSEPGIDRNTSLKQQLAVLNAGKDNPVKATPIERDARMSEEMEATEADYGPSNDKAQPISVEEAREPVIPVQVSDPGANANSQPTIGAQTKPAGATPENVINYRNISGSNSQPQPEKSENAAINYRSIKGSNEQPEGKKPEK